MKTLALISFTLGAALVGACGTHTAIGTVPDGGGAGTAAQGTGAAGKSGAAATGARPARAPPAARPARAPPAARPARAPPEARRPWEGRPAPPARPPPPARAARRASRGSACRPRPITAGDQPFTNPATVSGTWNRYCRGYQLPSGSDVLTLVFSKDATGATKLNVVMGTKAPTDSDLTHAGLARSGQGPGHNSRWEWPGHRGLLLPGARGALAGLAAHVQAGDGRALAGVVRPADELRAHVDARDLQLRSGSGRLLERRSQRRAHRLPRGGRRS